MKLFSLVFISFLLSLVNAKTHTWWYKAEYVKANPDGVYERNVVGFNGTWPLPEFRVKRGDRVNFYLINGIPNENTSLHFHGLFQNGTTQMDGPQMVNQCPMPYGEVMLYNFTVDDQVGTYWYHSHTRDQYGDGFRGPFIIEDDDYPFDFDEEVTLSISEWYHKDTDTLLKSFMNRFNPTGAEPIPQNLLFNNTRNVSWEVQPNTTYLLRIVNIGLFLSQYVFIEDHEFEVVAVDGEYVKPYTADVLYITAAQRYDVLITTKNSTDKNYAIMCNMDTDMLDTQPSDLVVNATNYLVYDSSEDLPDEYVLDGDYDELDDFYLEPLDDYEILPDADYTYTLDVIMDNLDDGKNYAFFNNITYTPPKVPTLVTALSAGDLAINEMIYGTSTNTFVLQKDDIIDIVVNNQDTGKHPFHLHGHKFQLLERHKEIGENDDPVGFNASDHAEWPEYPVLRDTAYVRPNSYMVLRFVADNPGVWLFHCHIEWHLEQGLAVVFVEAPEEIQSDSNQALTDDVKRSCTKNSIPLEGNAAGNSENYLDLTGQNSQCKRLPGGFTARGIVALVFSAIAAVLGLITIAFYGMADIKDVELRVARDLNIDPVEVLEEDAEESEITENDRERTESLH